MTGYGRALADRGGQRVVVEIRAVNHRFLDLKLRGGSLEPALEDKLQSRVRKRLSRGSITIAVRTDSAGSTPTVRIDQAAARRTYESLRELAAVLGTGTTISLDLVCAQPGVVVSVEPDRGSKALTEATLEAADSALEQLVTMREAEGKALGDDIAGRLDRLTGHTIEVDTLAASAPDDAKKRLTDRLNRLLTNSKVNVDEARLAQEVALLADRLDVTEELVRIRSHIDQLRALISADDSEPLGRRLDFLVQELGREYNTIASKSQSADIARVIVDAKADLEKIREQVQNIE